MKMQRLTNWPRGTKSSSEPTAEPAAVSERVCRGHRDTSRPPLVSMPRFPDKSWAQEPTGSAGHRCRRNSAALPALSDKGSVYSRPTDSCPSATFIYKMLVKLLTVGAVEKKLREKLTFLDLAGAHSIGTAPLSGY